MLLIGTRNFATQDVITNGIIQLGNVYRRYCKKINRYLLPEKLY